MDASRSKNRSKRASKPILGSNDREIMPLEYLLDAMNDDSVSLRRRDSIAKKIAPYLHAKLGRVSAEELSAASVGTNLENVIQDEADTEDGPAAGAESHAYNRRVAFSNLD